MRRFYREARAAADGSILLDGKPVRTPSGSPLAPPAPLLAEAIADEWNAQSERIEPRTMPLTGLANAAIDRIGPDRQAFAAGLARYGESDLVCYRAEGPEALVAHQAAHWDPILGWAQQRYDVVFEQAVGVIHMAQPPETIARLGAAVAARSPFELAGLSPLVTVSGSLLIALAVAEGALGLEPAWAAATLDEAWQLEQWGEDEDAKAVLAARRRDFETGARFLSLL